jgi:methionyl-tRNA formyltransferase
MKCFAFFGYDFFYSSIKALIEHGHSFKWLFILNCEGHNLQNNKVLALAEEHNAKIYFHKPTLNDIEQLIENGCELIISAPYKYEIPTSEKTMPLVINVHPTLLPEGNGFWSLPWVIKKGLKKNEITLHELDSEVDTSTVLTPNSFEATESDDLEILPSTYQMLAQKMLIELLENIHLYKNHKKTEEVSSYWKMPIYDNLLIDRNKDLNQILILERADNRIDFCANFEYNDWSISDLPVCEKDHIFKSRTKLQKFNKEMFIADKDGYACVKHHNLLKTNKKEVGIETEPMFVSPQFVLDCKSKQEYIEMNHITDMENVLFFEINKEQEKYIFGGFGQLSIYSRCK